MADGRNLCRLLQLASPMLPIGAYSYSQGLETAIEDGIVIDAAGTEAWVADVFRMSLCRFDLPILARLHRDWAGRPDRVAAWNALLLAGRDTAEAQAETRQTGYSLARLLLQLEIVVGSDAGLLQAMAPASLPLAFALAARCWGIGVEETVMAYAWSWAENQGAVAMKCVPIGQVAGQRILMATAGLIDAAVPGVLALGDDDICNFAPGLSIVSARHETQYSRLFRS
jgi:urease accessory protein